jgi:hypothetical protein
MIEGTAKPVQGAAAYALIVGRVVVEAGEFGLRILDVRRDLAFATALDLLAARSPGAVGHICRLPVDLPEPGDVLWYERTEGGERLAAARSRAGRRGCRKAVLSRAGHRRG